MEQSLQSLSQLLFGLGSKGALPLLMPVLLMPVLVHGRGCRAAAADAGAGALLGCRAAAAVCRGAAVLLLPPAGLHLLLYCQPQLYHSQGRGRLVGWTLAGAFKQPLPCRLPPPPPAGSVDLERLATLGDLGSLGQQLAGGNDSLAALLQVGVRACVGQLRPGAAARLRLPLQGQAPRSPLRRQPSTAAAPALRPRCCAPDPPSAAVPVPVPSLLPCLPLPPPPAGQLGRPGPAGRHQRLAAAAAAAAPAAGGPGGAAGRAGRDASHTGARQGAARRPPPFLQPGSRLQPPQPLTRALTCTLPPCPLPLQLGSGLESMQSIEMALPGREVRQAYNLFRAPSGVPAEEEEEVEQEFDLHGRRR
jgi:hypothetical protein